jgi:hypothetical protein
MIGHVRHSRAFAFSGKLARLEGLRGFWPSTPLLLGSFALRQVLRYHRDRPNLQLTPRFSKGTWYEPGIFGRFRGNGAAGGRL